MEKNITVLGSSNTDMIVKSPRIPAPGETILGGDFMTAHGGKGANQAVAAVRAGGNINFITCLGNDLFGRETLKSFKEEGLNTEHIYTEENVASGVAIINVAESGENSIAVASGANNRLLPDLLSKKSIEVIKRSAILLMQLEVPMETIEFAASAAYTAGVKIILNPAPAQTLSDRLLETLYLITPNETETELLTGIKVSGEKECEEAAGKLCSKGVKKVIITLGSRGSYYFDGTKGVTIPSYKVTAVDTTAAGDVFNGSLAVRLAENENMEDAIRFASAAAAISVTKAGAQPSAPQAGEIKDFLNNNNI